MNHSRRSAFALRFALMAALVVNLIARAALAQPGLSLVSPHRGLALNARLDPQLRAALDADLTRDPPRDPAGALRWALERTGERLHFGLGHRTSARFSAGEREGNCVEYAQLFAGLFNLAARREALHARARVIRSDARLFGMRLPGAALGHHDWVLVTESGTRRRWYVDPTTADAAMGWDLSGRVTGLRSVTARSLRGVPRRPG